MMRDMLTRDRVVLLQELREDRDEYKRKLVAEVQERARETLQHKQAMKEARRQHALASGNSRPPPLCMSGSYWRARSLPMN